MKDATTHNTSLEKDNDISNSPPTEETGASPVAEHLNGAVPQAEQYNAPVTEDTTEAMEDQTDIPTITMPRRLTTMQTTSATTDQKEQIEEDQTDVPTITMPRRSEAISNPATQENAITSTDAGADSQRPKEEITTPQASDPAPEPQRPQAQTINREQAANEHTGPSLDDGEATLTPASLAGARFLEASQKRKSQPAEKEAEDLAPVQTETPADPEPTSNQSSRPELIEVAAAHQAQSESKPLDHIYLPQESGSDPNAATLFQAGAIPPAELLSTGVSTLFVPETLATVQSPALQKPEALLTVQGPASGRPEALQTILRAAPETLEAVQAPTLQRPEALHSVQGTILQKGERRVAEPAVVGGGFVPPTPPTQTKKRRWPLWARIVLGVLAVLIVSGGGVSAYAYYYYENNIQQPLRKIIHPVSRSKSEPIPTTTVDTSNITGRPWNILLLGSDNDNKYTFPAVLTQVMMVIRVDPIQNQVTMVSIPRDSWVNVPDIGGMHKIDQAFFLGANQNDNFDDGVRAARNTIEQDYGIQIDRYAWVGLSGFAKVIDTLGGVDVDVTHPIVDDAYPDDTGGVNKNDPYALKRLYIGPGPQHLNGLQALEYVRSRHADLVGDIGRTQRQQQVLEALKTKLNAVSILQNLPQLMTDLNGSVFTDLSEQELISFANYGRTIINNPIQHITLGPGKGTEDYGELSNIYDPSANSNQDVVIPHCAQIQPVINRVFQLGNQDTCKVNG